MSKVYIKNSINHNSKLNVPITVILKHEGLISYFKKELEGVWFPQMARQKTQDRKVLWSIPGRGKKMWNIFSLAFGWLLWKLWDLPLCVWGIATNKFIINNHSYLFPSSSASTTKNAAWAKMNASIRVYNISL